MSNNEMSCAIDDLVKRLEIKAGVIEGGEKIAWGSDTALMREAAYCLKTLSKAKRDQARYKKLRTLNVRQFGELYLSNIRGEGLFDDLVDELIKQ